MRSYWNEGFGVALVAIALSACSSAPVTETPVPTQPNAPAPSTNTPVVSASDPRSSLRAGYQDAGVAVRNVELIGHVGRPSGFEDPNGNLGNLLYGNSDMAFRGNHLFVGNFHGFNIYDISNPTPRLVSSFVCPGGQGDMSIYGNLLFMSVEMPNGRVDCGTNAPTQASDPARFRGVRIFDVSNLAQPRQIAAVQTCRGSHTHTLVTDPHDRANVYIYVSGTSGVRPETELAGCSGRAPTQDTATAYFRIEVIQVPLAAPQNARIVNAPRIFADPATGNIAGLWPGGRHGEGTQATAGTNQCHDILVYPHFGIAAGACSGNGILLDISDAANPRRIDEVVDPNFAYWHSANFNNDATTVLFTDEWGGGSAARCQITDNPRWGADAIFRLANRRDMQLAGYYKLPAAQGPLENCVAHNGSLIPIPGRDVMVQGWYQGGISIFDWTDPKNVREIAFHDRGPLDATRMLSGGSWSVYWYNGYIVSSEIARGLDILQLRPSAFLTQNEIDAAKLVRFDHFNAQEQPKLVWPASLVVARAYLDQLVRGNALPRTRTSAIARDLDAAERLTGQARSAALAQLATQLDADAEGSSDAARVRKMTAVIRQLAGR